MAANFKRIGEDVSEKLDYTPGVSTVEQHVRGKWACRQCETLIQAPVPAQVIDKGIPTAGLLAHVMVAKFADHLPLYRQEKIFGRAGLAIARSTLAQWVGQTGVRLQPLVDALREAVLNQGVIHADETPVQMLAPGEKKTHRAYVWAYSSTPFSALKAVVYDFSASRAGEHARNFLGDWNGKLVCDDFAGYKAGFEQGITEIGCMAHARRKFFDLHVANKSQLAEQALHSIGGLYEIERQARDMSDEDHFAFLSFGGSQLMLEQDWHSESPWRVGPLEPPYGRGINLSIACPDASALVSALEAAGHPLRNPVEERWYRSGESLFGQRNFLVLDPDGYLLRFAEDIGSKPC